MFFIVTDTSKFQSLSNTSDSFLVNIWNKLSEFTDLINFLIIFQVLNLLKERCWLHNFCNILFPIDQFVGAQIPILFVTGLINVVWKVFWPKSSFFQVEYRSIRNWSTIVFAQQLDHFFSFFLQLFYPMVIFLSFSLTFLVIS